MAIRYADFRLDASSLRELPDGSVKVTGQLTHPGTFTYRNPDGSARREYRPAEEVFREDALASFAGAPITINHPAAPGGMRKVTAASWKQHAVGHLGDNVRQDGAHVVADLYVRDATAVAAVRAGSLKHISCGYDVQYDATPGVAPDGSRYDGVQRKIVGNHVALLPPGVAPRGGSECVLRLDSEGDERLDVEASESGSLNSKVTPEQIEALNAQITALTGELTKTRADAASVETLRADVVRLTAEVAAATALTAPERLDALVEERQSVCALATAAGVDPKGKSTLQVKRAIIAKRTPALAERADSYDVATADAVLAAYAALPHPSMAVLGTPATAARADAAPSRIPTISELHERAHKAELQMWKGN